MPNPYANLILSWERRLNRVDPDRRVRPFDWGSEWLGQTPVNGLSPWPALAPPTDVLPALRAWNDRVVAQSRDFFAYAPVHDYALRGDELGFTSPVEAAWKGHEQSGRPLPPVEARPQATSGSDPAKSGEPLASACPENRRVHARWFPVPGQSRAVIVVAQWNADEQGHIGLCRLFQRAGIASLRVSMPYHDRRRPAHLKRAEYTVDSNVGRTIHAARQAVCDIRASLDWLESAGYRDLGIVGTSLGSCYALLTSAHDPRLRVNVFNHVSHYFGDVVWTGLATAHVRQGLETHLDQAQLREAWRAISPASYLDQFVATSREHPKKNLLIWAKYDPCFLPEFSRRVLESFERLGLHHEAHGLPCGHYTIGRAPFKYADAYLMVRFLRRWL